MEMGFEDYVAMVKAGEIKVFEACAALGISRQTWYNRLKPKPVREPKQKPVKERRPVGRPRKEIVVVDGSPKIDWDAVKELEAAEQNEWLKKLSEANKVVTELLDKTFLHLWCNLRFEHVDAAAYWYTFELMNDDRRQTWCVRHSELGGI